MRKPRHSARNSQTGRSGASRSGGIGSFKSNQPKLCPSSGVTASPSGRTVRMNRRRITACSVSCVIPEQLVERHDADARAPPQLPLRRPASASRRARACRPGIRGRPAACPPDASKAAPCRPAGSRRRRPQSSFSFFPPFSVIQAGLRSGQQQTAQPQVRAVRFHCNRMLSRSGQQLKTVPEPGYGQGNFVSAANMLTPSARSSNRSPPGTVS